MEEVMGKKHWFFVFMFVLSIPVLALAYTNCPPADLSPNPAPVVKGGSSPCIAKTDHAELKLNQSWAEKVSLTAGKSYWYSATKCARASSLKAEVLDGNGNVIKSDSGARASFCFSVPKTGAYTIKHTVTGLNGSYNFAITQSCLSESKCSP
jgi:hypothetical protein